MRRGQFITLEGGEGAGKSSQVKNLAAFLREAGIEVIETREVGGAVSAEAIRDLWLTKGDGYWDAKSELLLIMAARREHQVKTIMPALERGAWVVSDRFVDLTRAYQGIGLGLGLEMVDEIYRAVTGDFEANLTLLLDLPVEAGLARMVARRGPDDRYQQKDKAFHETLRAAYLDLAKQYKQRFRIINASGDEAQVASLIAQTVKGFFTL